MAPNNLDDNIRIPEENMTPSAPIEVEVENEMRYPQVPDISSLDKLSTLTDMTNIEPPPYNPNNIYAQVIRNRTLSGDSTITVQDTPAGPAH